MPAVVLLANPANHCLPLSPVPRLHALCVMLQAKTGASDRKSVIPSQMFRDTLKSQLSSSLQIWIKRWRFADEDTALAHDNDRPTEFCPLSRPGPVKTESTRQIRIRERSLPLIYLLLLAASGVALIMILLSDHFILT
jgi:hypothetical protein